MKDLVISWHIYCHISLLLCPSSSNFLNMEVRDLLWPVSVFTYD